MPSNDELKTTAETLAKELGIGSLDTEGLSNKKLNELVSDLKAKKRDSELDTQADVNEGEARKAGNKAGQKAYDESLKKAKKEPAKKPPFYVKPGKALTSKRGILATERSAEVKDYTEIKAEDLAGGKDALNAFVESGHIGKA